MRKETIMSKLTYSVSGVTSVGPAHPNYNPQVRVTLYSDDEAIDQQTLANWREGHGWGLSKGHSPRDEDPATIESLWFQELLGWYSKAPAHLRRNKPDAAELTYTVHSNSSVGPAHPNYRPTVIVTVKHDGEIVERNEQYDYKVGHKWALSRGYTIDPEQADVKDEEWYQDIRRDMRMTV